VFEYSQKIYEPNITHRLVYLIFTATNNRLNNLLKSIFQTVLEGQITKPSRYLCIYHIVITEGTCIVLQHNVYC